MKIHQPDNRQLDPSKVRGIILDCGDVILHAPENRWWPPPFVAPILKEHGIDFIPTELKVAMDEGVGYLNSMHHMHTSDEEEERLFTECYRIALQHLQPSGYDAGLIAELVRMQSDPSWYIVYDETLPVLRELHARGYILQMLSNSYRFLAGIMAVKGLAQYFRGMTISACIGCMKPDERIYQSAIDETGLAPENLVYIDDIAKYVDKGMSMGMQGIILDRNSAGETNGLPVIHELRDLLGLFNGNF